MIEVMMIEVMIAMISMYTFRDGNNGRRVYLLTITIVTLKKRK
jgi:hypothetical protein